MRQSRLRAQELWYHRAALKHSPDGEHAKHHHQEIVRLRRALRRDS